MDSNCFDSESTSIPYFACDIVQGSNRVFVPIPYGSLENMCRALLANNPGTIIEVREISMLKF